MATAAHPSGQWSIISPWETTLIECRRIKNHPSDELEFVFRRGGQEYVFSAYSADFPNFHYATQLGDDDMGSALEQAIFQQAIRELDPVFSRAAQPEHVMRQLKAASQTIDLTLKDGTEGSCEFLENTGRFVEIPYGNPSHLPLYSWDQVQVIEAFADGFKVQAHPGSMAHAHSHGETFGCILFKDGKLAADGAYREYLQELEKLNEAVFRKEFHDHDPIAGGEHLVPRLRAFLRVNEFSELIVGFLFQWIDSSSKAACLRQLSPNDLRDGWAGYLATRCKYLFQKYRSRGRHITAKGRKEHILDMLCISVSGRPFIRLPDLGTYLETSIPAGDGRMKFRFSPDENDDDAALQMILTFLRDKTMQSRPVGVDRCLATFQPDTPYPLRSNSRNHFESLPSEVLDMILDYALLRPSVHCTEFGFCAWPPLDTALFETSKVLRRSALLRFVRNPFVVEYRFLGTFLRHVAGINVSEDDHLLTNKPFKSNIESWASLRDITLLISRDTYTEGTEHACRMRWLRRLGKGDCALPTLPLVIVQGHEWKLMFAELEDDLKVRLHRHLNLGTTRSVLGVYQVVASLRRLAEWAKDTYRPCFEKEVLLGR